MLTCGYRSPLAAPLHLALQRPPHPTLQIPPSPLLPSSYLHIPYTTLQVSSALQTLLFSFLSLQLARVYVIQNLGQAADGYNVQSVEVRSCREFGAGFDLHKLARADTSTLCFHLKSESDEMVQIDNIHNI